MSSEQPTFSTRLLESLRSELLFGRADEPLDAYGKRILRVVLSELESSERAASLATGRGRETSRELIDRVLGSHRPVTVSRSDTERLAVAIAEALAPSRVAP